MQGSGFSKLQPAESLPGKLEFGSPPRELSCGNSTGTAGRRSRRSPGVTGRLSALISSISQFLKRRASTSSEARSRRIAQMSSRNKFLKLRSPKDGPAPGVTAKKKAAWRIKCKRPRVKISLGSSPLSLLRRLKETYVPMMIAFASSKGKLIELDTVSCQYCYKQGFQPATLCSHCKENARRSAAYVRNSLHASRL